MSARVLFVSKPVVPPWSDGSKCLVRDIALHLDHSQAQVMSSVGAPALPGVRARAVYGGTGGFAPSLRDNARVALHLLFASGVDLWHFVMAPNPRTCRVARTLRALRRLPVVQTIASQPRSFEAPTTLFFGDVVVAQSQWTRQLVEQAWPSHQPPLDLQVIPPPLGSVPAVSDEARQATRVRLGVPSGAPLFVYPGDLEVSQGATRVAALVAPVVRELPDAVFVFACRQKTPHAVSARQEIEARLAAAPVRFAGELPDFHALLASATAVLFPVDDLYGKVDLPITLLECMALGVPVLALALGPLLDLRPGAELLDTSEEAWTAACLRMARDAGARAELSHRGRELVEKQHAATTVAAAYERIYDRLAAGQG